MKLKKVIALTMIATMTLAPMTAFADEVTEPSSASGGVTGSGGLEGYVDKNKFCVVLPTQSEAKDAEFTLDPQGLLKVADPTTYKTGAGAVYFPNAATDDEGELTYTYSNESDPYVIQNKSSYDVDVSFGVDVTLPSGVSLVEQSALENATTPSIYLAMYDGTSITTLKSGANAAAVKQLTKIAEDTTNTTMENATGYIITATPDENGGYTYAYELGEKATVAESGSVSYTLKGACDTTADWSAVNSLTDNKNVTTAITWSVAKHVDTPAAAPSIAATQYTLTADTALDISVSLGSGSKAATGISSVKHGDIELLDNGATFSDEKITISADTVNSLIQASEGESEELKVTFNDTDSTAATITLAIPAAAPSIATTTYPMVQDTAIEVAVDLGRGSLAATGVTSATWNGTDFFGNTITYADGVVTIGTTAVNYLLNKGADAEITITFNDSAATPVVITLTK